jgi:hypothetical protein
MGECVYVHRVDTYSVYTHKYLYVLSKIEIVSNSI